MARESPAQKIARIGRGVSAWKTHAAGTSFYGKTLAQFQSAVQPSYDARTEIAQLNRQLAAAIKRRIAADVRSLRLLRSVVFAVLGHPDHAEDSALYGAMGYVPRSARRRKRRRQQSKR